MPSHPQAPPWTVSQWFNAPQPLDLQALRGRVIVLHAFQMLCPGCVQHGLPQAQRVADQFPPDDVAVVGLHSVFEHHEAMPPHALAAFLHEYRIRFPVAVDAAGVDGPLPQTMRAYGMRGTPTLVLIDRAGHIRRHAFGAVADLELGAEIMRLVLEPIVDAGSLGRVPEPAAPGSGPVAGCDDGVCSVDR